MTSPVDTSVKHFFSGTGAAPVLTKQPGSLIALLDAVLVLGYDLKAATAVVVSGGVATVQYSGDHSATPHAVILVSGATGAYAPLNGEQKVLTKGNGSLTFATAVPAGTAAGTISFKMAPAGWAKPFSAENIAVYKSLDPMSYGHYLRVDDTGNPIGPGYARVRGYSTMTDVNTGVGPFPINEQIGEDTSNGGFWPKGANASAGTNPISWSIYADSRVFFYGPQQYQSNFEPSSAAWPKYFLSHLEGFGDMLSYRPGGDPYAVVISGHNQSVGSQSYVDSGVFSGGGSTYPAMAVPRKADGSGFSQLVFSAPYGFLGQAALSGRAVNQYGTFPNVIDGTMIYAPRYIRPFNPTTEDDFAPRCEVPGLLSIPQNRVYEAIGKGAILDGEGRWAGRKLFGHLTGNPPNDGATSQDTVGITLVDITGPWR